MAHRDGSALAHERDDCVVAARPTSRLHTMQTSQENINPGILRFLMSVASQSAAASRAASRAASCAACCQAQAPATETRETQTTPPPAPAAAAAAAAAAATGASGALAAAAACDDELFVYMPWTGLILELLPIKDEQCSDDSTFVSTLSVSELRDVLGNGSRPHVNQRCFQGFVTDVRMQVQRSAGFANHQSVSYTPVYKVWLPADGSHFEVSGLSLPSPVKRSPTSSWSSGEVLAMESYALGEGALEHGLMGDEYTWIPVLAKSCRTRVCMKKDFSTIAVKYPPTELRTSRELPGCWQDVLALPHVQDAPLQEELGDPARRFPHIGRLAAARQLAFTPVLLRDVLARNTDFTNEHRALYRSARDRFLAHMRPLFELLAGGGDPRAHGWTQLAKQTDRGLVYEWIHAQVARKRKAEDCTGSMTTQTIW